MAVRKLESTDGFVIVDFPDVPAAGPIRRAKKILQSSATDLARSASYTFASFEMERAGASGGLNAEGDKIPDAVEALIGELTGDAEAGQLHLYPGKGMSAEQLAPLAAAAKLNSLAGSDKATTAGVVAAASWAVGGSLQGKKVAIEQTAAAPAPADLAQSLAAVGAEVVDVPGVAEKPWMIWGADVDVILAGTKPGTLTHQGTDFVKAAALVPWGQIPFTTKAVAQLLKKGETIVVPDFISAAGGLIAGYLPGDEADIIKEIVSSVAMILTEVGSHEDGPLLAACYRAEAFMTGWQGKAPFGRPLAA
ncbi:MAG: hypothetical protein ACRBK7_27240 [Acidimicrobiales bacterium]